MIVRNYYHQKSFLHHCQSESDIFIKNTKHVRCSRQQTTELRSSSVNSLNHLAPISNLYFNIKFLSIAKKQIYPENKGIW